MTRYLLEINLGIMLCINLFFFAWFEKEKPGPEDILPVVVVSTAAGLGRIIFAPIPQVQPVTALVIIMGSVCGAKKGYMTGAISALVSNMMLGQGPWTLFQMAAWGMVGVLAAQIGKLPVKNERLRIILFAVYGFFSAYLFSFITDFLTICYIGEGITVSEVAAVFASGFAFALPHAIGNVVMLVFFYQLLAEKLERVNKKLLL